MFKLFTDTDTDITPEVASEYGYQLISMPYTTSDGKDTYPYVDFEEYFPTLLKDLENATKKEPTSPGWLFSTYSFFSNVSSTISGFTEFTETLLIPFITPLLDL